MSRANLNMSELTC